VSQVVLTLTCKHCSSQY